MDAEDRAELLAEMRAAYRRYVGARSAMEQAQAEYERASQAYWKMRVIAAPCRELDKIAREAVAAEEREGMVPVFPGAGERGESEP
jgi:hypothetical protein